MHLLTLTLPSAAENLALDEALLECAEQADRPAEVLRLWEPTSPIVVLGSSSRAAREAKLPECHQQNIPVLRRASGGATILTGPGCLMYGVVLSYELHPELRSIDRAHQFVLSAIISSLQPKLFINFPAAPERGRDANADRQQRESVANRPSIARSGTSDLTVEEKKFSGNSLRCKRTHLLYHGTLLYNFPLQQVEQFLGCPARQPAYRANRTHRDFLTNLPLEAATIRQTLIDAFQANEPLPAWPQDLTHQLSAEKYTRDEWNFRL